MRCTECGATNRVRLVYGRKVRVRCGRCGAVLPLTPGRAFRLALSQQAGLFFTRYLPLGLLAAVDFAFKFFGLLLSPLRILWRRLPRGLRQRIGWIALAALVVSYAVLEGTLKLSSLLLLIAVLFLALAALILIAHGPRAFLGLLGQTAGRVFRVCPFCGHRNFAWLRHCPRCNR